MVLRNSAISLGVCDVFTAAFQWYGNVVNCLLQSNLVQ